MTRLSAKCVNSSMLCVHNSAYVLAMSWEIDARCLANSVHFTRNGVPYNVQCACTDC